MLEGVARVMWILLSGAFIFGAWSTTLEIRTRNQGEAVEYHERQIVRFNQEYSGDQRKIIDILGRMDERLKNLERRSK